MHLSATASLFSSLGLPGWLAYLVAGAAGLGGLGLLVPRFGRPAALGLIIIMLGAVFMHATKIPGGLPEGVPALALLGPLVVVVLLRRPAPAVA